MLVQFGRQQVQDNLETANTKRTIMRIYEVMKTYMHMFDIEKLMDNYKQTALSKQSHPEISINELSFLINDLKHQVSLQTKGSNHDVLTTVFNHLDYDMKHIELLKNREKASPHD